MAWRPEMVGRPAITSSTTPTGTLVVDGERAPIDLACPAQPAALAMSWQRLRNPASTRLRFGHAGKRGVVLQRGWPFLLVDVSVGEDGTATLRRSWVATMRLGPVPGSCGAA